MKNDFVFIESLIYCLTLPRKLLTRSKQSSVADPIRLNKSASLTQFLWKVQ
jgi:hypothetical protein